MSELDAKSEYLEFYKSEFGVGKYCTKSWGLATWNRQQKMIDFKDKCIENLKLQLENKQIDCDRSDEKVDELQAKIDTILALIETTNSNEYTALSDIKFLKTRFQEILK